MAATGSEIYRGKQIGRRKSITDHELVLKYGEVTAIQKGIRHKFQLSRGDLPGWGTHSEPNASDEMLTR